jgi:dihydroneopterin aldolase
MTIAIRDYRFRTIIGLLDHERKEEQEIVVDLEIDYDYRDGKYLDYARVAEEVREHLQQERYELLEEALLGLEKLLRGSFPTITRLACTLSKPHILPHAEVSLSREWRYGKRSE